VGVGVVHLSSEPTIKKYHKMARLKVDPTRPGLQAATTKTTSLGTQPMITCLFHWLKRCPQDGCLPGWSVGLTPPLKPNLKIISKLGNDFGVRLEMGSTLRHPHRPEAASSSSSYENSALFLYELKLEVGIVGRSNPILSILFREEIVINLKDRWTLPKKNDGQNGDRPPTSP
jgi:hypothetical protein